MPILFFALETFIFFLVTEHFGFLQAIVIYFLPTILGILALSFFAQNTMSKLQNQVLVAQGGISSVIKNFAVFVGLLLWIPPTFTTRLFGLLLILPPTRYLLMGLSQFWLFKKVFSNGIEFFQSSQGNTFYQNGNLHANWSNQSYERPMKDVTPHKPNELEEHL